MCCGTSFRSRAPVDETILQHKELFEREAT